MSQVFEDDRTPIVIPFILEHLQSHRQTNPAKPLFVGLNGVQGSGKTTLVDSLERELASQGVRTLVYSIDDFYLTHEDQVRLAASQPDNKLLQHRGQPGTHDVKLLTQFVDSVFQGSPVKLPSYDKSAYQGQGDRSPESHWRMIDHKPEVLILEGWCVGFRPTTPQSIKHAWSSPSRTLRSHELAHLLHVNDHLIGYCGIYDLFDVFIHVDAEDSLYAYDWRQEQEDHLRLKKGDPRAGMSPEQVVRFVDGYYPAYELYTEGLRKGIMQEKPGRQLRLVVGRDRKVREAIRL